MVRDEIRKWLKAPSFVSIHNAAMENRTDGTGTWFLESIEFRRFKEMEGCVLWCTGKREYRPIVDYSWVNTAVKQLGRGRLS